MSKKMNSPWTRHKSVEGTPNTTRQSLNFSSFLDSSYSGRSEVRSSMAGQILEETAFHRVETFGLTIPVQIREALTARNVGTASQYPSIKLHESGWAWLVCGRKLFIWRYISSQGSKSLYCKELPLPSTELYHTAELVTVLPATRPLDISNPGSIAVMMVSPEGVVRYWPCPAQDTNCIELNLDLSGHPSRSLTAFQFDQLCGSLLITNGNEVMMLLPKKKSIEVHPLKASGGMFSLLGRRLTSIIFGSQQSSDETMTARKIVVGDHIREHSKTVYVLSGNQLAQWEINITSSNTVQEKLCYQCDCDNMFTQAASQALEVPIETVDQLTVWCLDVCTISEGIVILAAVALKGPSHTTFFYMFGALNYSTEEPQALASVNVIQFSEQYSPSHQEQLLDYKMLLPRYSTTVFVYSSNSIICVQAYKTDDIINKIDFNTPGDSILGGGVLGNKALFFSRKNGVLNVTVSEDSQQIDLSMTRTRLQEVTQSTLPEISLSQDFIDGESSSDQATKFKEAFLLFCQQKIIESQSICSKLFSLDSSGLDTCVAALSQELIDDYPASDPRWAESIPAGGISASSSLIILHQLEDKLKAHEFFVNFLKGVGLWDKLKVVKVREQSVPTWCLLCEHSEKLCAAIALCREHKTYQDIVDAAIGQVITKRGTTSTAKGLSEADLFFREVSHIEEIFDGFLEYEDGAIKSASNPHVEIVLGVNNLMKEMLEEAWNFRQQNSGVFQVDQQNHPENELMFWTGTLGPKGMRTIIKKQIQVTVQRGILGTEDNKVRSSLYDQIVCLADILLDGYLIQLESLQSVASKKDRYDEVLQTYEQDRRAVILPLVEFHQYSQATSLAEKYQAFGILIQLCEERGDKQALEKYSLEFKDQGFSDYLFKWYMDKGERHKLMNQPAQQHENLGKFLSSHHHLSWLHDVHTKSFYEAHQTLQDLAENEKSFVQRKKTLLSLSKLALLAADDSDVAHLGDDELQQRMDIINNEQDVILYQETLPANVLKNAKINADAMPPLTPTDLIELYVGDKNPRSNEYDFKRALSLLRHAENFGCEDVESLKRHIWTRAILKDNWSSMRDIDPLASARRTVFFKTVELAYNQGLNLKDFMPSMESLLESDDLKSAGLSDNANFRYLLSAGYEQIKRSADNTSMMVE